MTSRIKNSIPAIALLCAVLFATASWAAELDEYDFSGMGDQTAAKKEEKKEDKGSEKITASDVFSLLNESETVSIASKKEESIRDAPATVYVITRRQIIERGYKYLHDLIRDVPGVDLIDDMGTYGMIAMQRGIDTAENNKTLIFMDGVQINNPSQGVAYMNYHLSLFNVKRVEVLWGPASALYGANAYAGVINIVTVSADDLDHNVYVNGGAVNYAANVQIDGYFLEGIVAKRFGSAKDSPALVVSGNYLDSKTGPRKERLVYSKAEGVKRDTRTAIVYGPEGVGQNPPLGNYSAYAKFNWQDLTIGFRAWHQLSRQGLFANYNASEHALSTWGVEGEDAFVRYTWGIGNKVDAYSQISWRQSRLADGGENMRPYDADRDDFNHDLGGTLLWYRREDMAVNYDQQFSIDWTRRINSIFGFFAEYANVGDWNTNGAVNVPRKVGNSFIYEPRYPEDQTGVFRDGKVLFEGTRPVDKPETQYHQINIAGYAQGNVEFMQKFNGILGARLDYFRLLGEEGPQFIGSEDYTSTHPAGDGLRDKPISVNEAGAQNAINKKGNYFSRDEVNFDTVSVNPRAGLIFHSGKNTTFKLLHGWAFRNPTVRERYSIGGSRIPAGRDLKPEEIKTTELGANFRLHERIRLETDVFLSHASGLIQLTATDIHRPKKNPDVFLSQFTNASDATLMGGELKLDAILAATNNFNLSLFGNYSFQNNTYDNIGKNDSFAAHKESGKKYLSAKELEVGLKDRPKSDAMPRIANHKFNTGLAFTFFQDWVVAPRLNYVGQRPNVVSSPQRYVDPYILVNLNLAWLNEKSGLTVTLQVLNLLDAQIDDPGTRDAGGDYYSPVRPQSARSIWLAAGMSL